MVLQSMTFGPSAGGSEQLRLIVASWYVLPGLDVVEGENTGTQPTLEQCPFRNAMASAHDKCKEGGSRAMAETS
jgi:hypothetical protein